VQDNVRRGRDQAGGLVAGRKVEDGWSGKVCPGGCGEGEVAFDGMGFRADRDGLGLGKAGAFTGVRESDDRNAPESTGDQGGAEESLEIKDEVGLVLLGQTAPPLEKSEPSGGPAKIGPRKEESSVKTRVPLEERCPFRVDHPREVRGREGSAQGSRGRQGMDDVTERAGLEDEDALRKVGSHVPRARRSASSAGRPASRILRRVVSMS
jgi:hypothetical protein